MKNLVVGEIVKTDSGIGGSHWKVALNVTSDMLESGVNAEKTGIHLFYGMWYGDDPLDYKSFGKIESLDKYTNIVDSNGFVSDYGKSEIKKLLGG